MTREQLQSIRFIVFFGMIYGLFHAAYMLLPDEVLSDQIYPLAIGELSAAMINVIDPQEQAVSERNMVMSRFVRLDIVRGCDGSGVWFLIIAAIFAFPASWRNRALGALLATLLVYAVNQVRIVGLYFVVARQESWFVTVHTLIAPTLIIVIVSAFFLWWASFSTRDVKVATRT